MNQSWTIFNYLLVRVPLPADTTVAVAPRVPTLPPPLIIAKFATLGVLTKSLAMLRVSGFGPRVEPPMQAWLSARVEFGTAEIHESKLSSPSLSLKYFLSECIIDQNRAMAYNWAHKICFDLATNTVQKLYFGLTISRGTNPLSITRKYHCTIEIRKIMLLLIKMRSSIITLFYHGYKHTTV